MAMEISPYPDPAEVMTTQEAADYLRVTRRTLYRYIHDGKIKAPLIGAQRRILKRDLAALLQGETGRGQTVVNPTAPTPVYRSSKR